MSMRSLDLPMITSKSFVSQCQGRPGLFGILSRVDEVADAGIGGRALGELYFDLAAESGLLLGSFQA